MDFVQVTRKDPDPAERKSSFWYEVKGVFQCNVSCFISYQMFFSASFFPPFFFRFLYSRYFFEFSTVFLSVLCKCILDLQFGRTSAKQTSVHWPSPSCNLHLDKDSLSTSQNLFASRARQLILEKGPNSERATQGTRGPTVGKNESKIHCVYIYIELTKRAT